MEYLEPENSRAEMVTYVNRKKYMTIPIPFKIQFDILNYIHHYSYPEKETPEEKYVEILNGVLNKRVNLQIISYLTKLDINYLEDLKNGILRPENSKKLGDLLTILSILNDFS